MVMSNDQRQCAWGGLHLPQPSHLGNGSKGWKTVPSHLGQYTNLKHTTLGMIISLPDCYFTLGSWWYNSAKSYPRALLLSGCLLRTATSWPNASQVCDHECLGIANPSEINYLTTIWDDFSPHTFPNPHPKCENRKCCAWNQEPHIHCVFDANFPIWLRRLLRWFGNFLVVQHLFVWFIQNRLRPTRIKLSNSQN